jgi:DNA-binding MarR family transcriptional regulator
VTYTSEEIAARLDRLVIWARHKAPAPMSATSITTLDTLAYAGPLRISELAERERLTQPGMTIVVNRLEATGHAERFADPTDGRATLVRITAAGRQLLAARGDARADALVADIDALPAADRATLAAAIGAIDRLTGVPMPTPVA